MTNLEWLYRSNKRFRNYVTEELWCGDLAEYGMEFDRRREAEEWLLDTHVHEDELMERNTVGPW